MVTVLEGINEVNFGLLVIVPTIAQVVDGIGLFIICGRGAFPGMDVLTHLDGLLMESQSFLL